MELTKSKEGLLLLFSALVITSLDHVCGKPALKAVSMLTRHGDRSPLMTYPLDPYLNYSWPGGQGSLSPIGAQQLYHSGVIKSLRYSSLLNRSCHNKSCSIDTNNILVLSSSARRCISSATHFLDAFLKGTWSPDLIRIILQDEDEIIRPPGKPCSDYEYLYIRGPEWNTPEVIHIIDRQSPNGRKFLNILEENTGLTIKNTYDILALEDILLIQLDHGLELPAWVKSIYDKHLNPMALALFDLWSSSDYMKIRGGRLLNDIIERLQSYTEGSSNQNILLYSGHDTTIASLIHTLGVRKQTDIRPNYGAMLSLELYENIEVKNDLEIKIVYYQKHSDNDPIIIEIPHCKVPCPFKKFSMNMQTKLIKNYKESCIRS
ncbi:lysosomal acid phosphatase-like [Hermetia illucens]|uniref:lysosomal acid phosphatase-like n=1 Tax=Hermetia illucens TaxID=343691 RepID=UPI0018CC7AA7|nr:lysosomal acid phosphatase-like [Hermetia illucens]